MQTTDEPVEQEITPYYSSSSRKAKARKGSTGSKKAAPETTGSSQEHLSEDETSGPLADGEASLSGSDIKVWGDEEDHQQGLVLGVQSFAGEPSWAGGALKAKPPATTSQALRVPVAVAGAKGTSSAPSGPLFPAEKENEEEGAGGVSGGKGLISAASSTGEDRRREEVRGGFSSHGGDKGGDEGGLDSEGRSGSRKHATEEKGNDTIGGAGITALNQKVCVHAD